MTDGRLMFIFKKYIYILTITAKIKFNNEWNMKLEYATFYFNIGSHFLSQPHVLLKFNDLFRSHVPFSLPSHSSPVPVPSKLVLHIEIK